MTTCLLIRHGQSEANVAGVLAGHLDSNLTQAGLDQATRLAQALAEVPIRRIVTSPLSRCQATAAPLAANHREAGEPVVEVRVAEVHYGAWTGAKLTELAADDLWSAIQSTPSAVTFPVSDVYPHESMVGMSERAWQAWQHWDSEVSAEHGPGALWALVSHGDVIKALLARCLGLDLDAFQSIMVDPGSVSIVVRHAERTAVAGLNLRDDTYARLARTAAAAEAGAEAAVEGAADNPTADARAVDAPPTQRIGVVGGGDG